MLRPSSQGLEVPAFVGGHPPPATSRSEGPLAPLRRKQLWKERALSHPTFPSPGRWARRAPLPYRGLRWLLRAVGLVRLVPDGLMERPGPHAPRQGRCTAGVPAAQGARSQNRGRAQARKQRSPEASPGERAGIEARSGWLLLGSQHLEATGGVPGPESFVLSGKHKVPDRQAGRRGVGQGTRAAILGGGWGGSRRRLRASGLPAHAQGALPASRSAAPGPGGRLHTFVPLEGLPGSEGPLTPLPLGPSPPPAAPQHLPPAQPGLRNTCSPRLSPRTEVSSPRRALSERVFRPLGAARMSQGRLRVWALESELRREVPAAPGPGWAAAGNSRPSPQTA